MPLAIKVCIVPMRNWNIEITIDRKTPKAVCIVPMRNWNVIELRTEWTFLTSLYRTYEELKPPLSDFPFSTSTVCIVPMRNWNFLLLFFSDYHSRVCIVPMRNWNYQNASRWFNKPKRFVSYLWGIETRRVRASIPYLAYLVCIVPMRNWNLRECEGGERHV